MPAPKPPKAQTSAGEAPRSRFWVTEGKDVRVLAVGGPDAAVALVRRACDAAVRRA